jgi:hypothetical protein
MGPPICASSGKDDPGTCHEATLSPIRSDVDFDWALGPGCQCRVVVQQVCVRLTGCGYPTLGLTLKLGDRSCRPPLNTKPLSFMRICSFHLPPTVISSTLSSTRSPTTSVSHASLCARKIRQDIGRTRRKSTLRSGHKESL